MPITTTSPAAPATNAKGVSQFSVKSHTPHLVAAPFTPLKPDGSLNFSQLEPYAEKLSRDGVCSVFVCGTTGEGMSLTQAERKALVEQWKSAVGNDMRFMVHVGHSSVGEAQELARHAQRIGVDAIAAIGPIFFTPSHSLPLVEMCRQIASAAPDTPFYYYHMPSMSRVPFPAHSLFTQMVESIPSFKGVKFTHEDMDDYGKCLELAGSRYDIFFGRDEMLLDGLKYGAKAAIGSTYNFAAPLYLKMAAAYSAGNESEAKKLQKLCADAIDIMVRYDGLVGIKTTLKLAGIDCGSVRVPLKSLTLEETRQLEKELDALGYFQAVDAARSV